MGIRLLLLFFLLAPLIHGQEISPNEKAARYHKLLLKRPGNPTVFSRFVEAWLDTEGKKELKSWLEKSAETGNTEHWRILAAYHDYLGEDQLALKAFDHAVEKSPDSAELRLARAKLQARLLSFEAALTDLEIAMTDEKTGAEASKLRGIYLARSGRIDEALTAWKELIQRYPNDEELLEDLIEIQVAEGLYSDATASSAALVAMTKDPYQRTLRQLRLGDLQILSDDQKTGLETYQKIVSATGAGTWLEREVLAQIERVFLRDDNVKGLRDFYQKLVESHPRRVSIRKALAHQMAANKELKEAIALFREIIKITPGDLGNREEFISFLETHKQWKEASEELRELIKQRPDDPQIWEHLVRIETSLENLEGIKTALNELLRLRDDSPEGLIAVANLHTQSDLQEDAENILRKARTTFPNSEEVTEALASHLIRNDNADEAIKIWEKMAAEGDRETLLRISRSLSSHGEQGAAFALLGSRITDYQDDPLIYARYCQLARSPEESAMVLSFAIDLVNLAKAPTELESAVKLTRGLVLRAKKLKETITSLEKQELSITKQCFLASLVINTGDHARANAILEKAEAADDSLLTQFFRVHFEEELGNDERAIALLRKIIAQPEGRKTVHFRRLVMLLERNDDVEAALAAVEEWKRSAPGDQAAWLRRANLLLENEKPAESITELRRLIGKFGPEPETRARLAEALQDAGELRPARRIYEQLYEEAEDLHAKLKWVTPLARLAEKQAELPQLLEDFERRKRANPTSVAPLLALAEIHRELDQPEKRRSALLEASRRRPDDIKLLLRMAREEERAGEFQRAFSILNDAIKKDRSDKALRQLANLHLKRGEIQPGLRILSRIPGESEDPRNIETTASALLSAGEVIAALNHLRGLVGKHPQDWRLQYLLGICHELEEEPEKAFEIYAAMQDVTNKINGVKPLLGRKSSGKRNRYSFPQLPSGWQELAHLENLISRDAYALRQAARGRSSGFTLVNLPGNASEARRLSTLRAAINAPKEEEDQKAAFARLNRLPSADVENLTLFLEQSYHNEDLSKRLLEKFSAPKAAEPSPLEYYLWLSHEMEEGQGADKKLLKSAFKSVAQINPYSAATLFFTGNNNRGIPTKEHLNLLKIIMELTPEKQKSEVFERLFEDGYRSTRSRRMTKESNQDLAELLLTQALALPETETDTSWFKQAFNYAVGEKKIEESLTLLNRISAGHVSANAGGFSRLSLRRSKRRESLSLPPYPGPDLEELPDTLSDLILSQLKTRDTASDPKILKLLAELSPKLVDPSSNGPLSFLSSSLDQVQDETTRRLMALTLSSKEDFPTMMETLATAPDQTSLMLAAGYYARELNYSKTYTILQRLHLLPLSREMRQDVDGHLTHLGAILVKQAPEGFDPSPAERAGLRLRRNLFGNERQALIKHLVALGLEKEATRLKDTVTVAQSSRNSSRQQRRKFTGLPAVFNHLSFGKRDQAIREAVKSMRAAIRSGSSWDLSQSASKLTAVGLGEKILEELRPGPDASANRMKRFAELAVQLNDDETAAAIYQDLLKAKPDDEELLVEMLALTPVENWKDHTIKAETYPMLWYTAGEESEERHMKVTALAAEYLEAGAPGATAESLEKLQSSIDSNFESLSNSDDPFSSSNVYTVNDIEYDPKDKRLQLRKRLMVAMLNHPKLVQRGYRKLTSDRRYLGISEEELLNLAHKSVRTMIVQKEEKPPENDYAGSGLLLSWGPVHSILNEEGVTFFHQEEVMELLKKHRPKDAELLTLLQTVARGAEDESLTAYRKWEANLSEKEEKKLNQLHEFVKLLSRYKIETKEWIPLFHQHVLTHLKETSSARSSTLLRNWAEILMETGGASKLNAFLTVLLEEQMLPQEKWHLIPKLGVTHLPMEYGQKVADVASLLESIGNRLTKKAELGIFVTRYQLLDVMTQVSRRYKQYSYLSRRIFWPKNTITPEEFIEWLGKNGHMARGEGDKPLPKEHLIFLTRPNGSGSNDEKDWGPRVVELLAKQDDFHPDAVGLLSAFLEKNPARRNAFITGVTERNPNLLADLQEHNEKDLERTLKIWWKDSEPVEGTVAGEFIKKRKADARERHLAEIAQWRKNGIPVGKYNSYGQKLWPPLAKVAVDDIDLAVELMTTTLTQAKNLPGETGLDFFDQRPPAHLESWVDIAIMDLLAKIPRSQSHLGIRLLDQLYRGEAGRFLPELTYTNNRELEAIWAAFSTTGKDELVLKEIKESFTRLGQELTTKEQHSFAALVIDPASQNWSLSNDSSRRLTTWADDKLRAIAPYLADTLVSLSTFSSRSTPQKEGPQIEKAHAALKRMIIENEAPTALRHLFAASWLRRLRDIPLEVMRDREVWDWALSTLRDYAEGKRRGIDTNSFWIFYQISRSDPTGLEVEGGKLLELYQKHYAKGSQRIQWAEYLDRSLVPHALAAGEKEFAMKILSKEHKDMMGRLDVMLALVEAGEEAEAKKLHPGSDGPFPYWINLKYNKRVERLGAKLIEIFEKPDERKSLELALAKITDGEGDEAPSVKQDSRITELARRYLAKPPIEAEARRAMLLALTGSKEPAEILREALAQEMKGHSFALAGLLREEARRDDPQSSYPYMLLRRHLLLELKHGNFDPLEEHYQALLAIEGQWEDSARSYAFDFIGDTHRLMIRQATEDPEAARKIAALSRRLTETLLKIKAQNIHEHEQVRISLILHVLSGETEQWDKLVTGHEAEKSFKHRGVFRELLPQVSDKDWGAEELTPIRKKTAAALLGNQRFRELVLTEPTSFKEFATSGFLKKEELSEAVELQPDGPWKKMAQEEIALEED